MIQGVIGQAKGFDSSSILFLLSLVCEICIWQFLSATVANFLLHSGFRQVKSHSCVLSSLSLTLSKLIFGYVNDGFLVHSSAAGTVLIISAASSFFVELGKLQQSSEGPFGTVFCLTTSFYILTSRALSASIVIAFQCWLLK